jgi:hypothetical protein
MNARMKETSQTCPSDRHFFSSPHKQRVIDTQKTLPTLSQAHDRKQWERQLFLHLTIKVSVPNYYIALASTIMCQYNATMPIDGNMFYEASSATLCPFENLSMTLMTLLLSATKEYDPQPQASNSARMSW